MSLRHHATTCVLLTLASAGWAQSPVYKQAGSIQIGGRGGWDYLTADEQNRRLYVSHETEVEVINLDSEKPIGKISGMTRIHGIALANDLGVGFISDGGANELVEFGLKNLQVQRKIKAGTNPDGILYDNSSKRVFAFNGRSQDATVINAANGTSAGNIKLGGKPEFPVSDGKGSIFVNIEDRSEIAKIDANSLQIQAHWTLKPCESPSGLAIDPNNRRLFSVCDNKLMAIVDADSGKVVATPAIGEGPDAAAFDPAQRLVFSSNGESGTLTVIRQVSKDEYREEPDVKTADGARTMTLDRKTHRLYLPTADFGPATKPTQDNPHPRRSILPGTFRILVLVPSLRS
jgi:DNA-binding beta-propeller fold protein YncE